MISFFHDHEMKTEKPVKEDSGYYYFEMPGQDQPIKVNKRICSAPKPASKKDNE